MSKKSRKRNKKILAALALAGGAAMLAKGRGKGAVSTAGQAVGVDRITPQSKYIQKKVVPDVVEPAAETGSGFTAFPAPGTLLNQRKKMPGYGVEGPPSILNPYNPRKHVGRGVFKGGGRTGAKKGGRVKSMGVAKRGGGAAIK